MEQRELQDLEGQRDLPSQSGAALNQDADDDHKNADTNVFQTPLLQIFSVLLRWETITADVRNLI